MPLTLDPEIKAVVDASPQPRIKPPFRSIAVRRQPDSIYATVLNKVPDSPDVTYKDFFTSSSDGHQVLLRWFTKSGSQPGSAVLYTHGGGLIVGCVEWHTKFVAQMVQLSGVPFLSVEYRLAPEAQYPLPLEDAYAGLTWLHAKASELGVDNNRIAVLGDSAGGAIAATVTLLARERQGPKIAKQILIYPMLDDRNMTANPAVEPFLIWSAEENKLGWTSYLGDKQGTEDIPETAAAGRLIDGTGLPTTYIEVGELDLFREENVQFADKIAKAGVSVELHVWPGCPHAFELLAPNGHWAKQAYEARIRALKTI
jgi:acetyl esterase/lipase